MMTSFFFFPTRSNVQLTKKEKYLYTSSPDVCNVPAVPRVGDRSTEKCQKRSCMQVNRVGTLGRDVLISDWGLLLIDSGSQP